MVESEFNKIAGCEEEKRRVSIATIKILSIESRNVSKSIIG